MNLRGKILQFLLVGPVEFLDEMIRQQIDILRSVFDWRDHDSRDRKPVKQIFAQLIFLQSDLWHSIDTADDPDIDFDIAAAAKTTDLFLFQDTKQFRL